MKKWKREVNNKLKGVYGVTDFQKREIQINKKLHKKDGESMIDTIVHEEMHMKHPRMKEKTVRKLTPKKVKKMSKKAKSNIRNKYK
jgi:predicted SprT family Zn-dependent metalloprotease